MATIPLALLILFQAYTVCAKPIYQQAEVQSTRIASDQHTCTINGTESCSIANMPRDESTQVYPGLKTRCIMSDSTDYSFQVIPGNPDNLLFYFQGGGACWSEQTTSPLFCSVDAIPADLVGVFNRTDPHNRYKNYTIIHVLYCSGDVHAGNITRDYNDNPGPQGEPVEQMGYFNAKAVVDWTVQQQDEASLSGVFKDLVLMGCSAGAIGAQVWTDILLDTLPHEQAGVVPDSYLGVFPTGVEGDLIYDYGFCTTPLTDPSLQAACDARALTFEDIMMNSFPKHVDVPFGFIQSKVDSIQLLFYTLLGAPSDQNVTQSEFYYYSNAMLETYNTNDNVAVYLVDGPTHCFTNYDRYYTADTCGSNEDSNNTDPTCNKDSSVKWMYDWTNTLPFPNVSEGIRATLDTTCSGDVMDPDWSSNSTTYCDASLVNKTIENMPTPYDPVPSSDGDDDDGIDTSVVVAVIVGLAVVFVAIVGCCICARREAAAEANKSSTMKNSLLTPAEKRAANDDGTLFVRESRNSAESVEL